MTRRPKKSEMLEVRLSHADKEALKRKAALDGLTVSAAVRGLIADYLREPDPVAVLSSHRKLVMTFFKHPIKSTAALASTIATSLLLVSTAHADPVKLAVDLEYSETIEQDGHDGVRTRRANTEVHIDDLGVVCFNLDDKLPCRPDGADMKGMTLVLSAVPEDDNVFIELKFMENGAVIAEPRITIRSGETGSFITENGEGNRIALSITSLEG